MDLAYSAYSQTSIKKDKKTCLIVIFVETEI